MAELTQQCIDFPNHVLDDSVNILEPEQLSTLGVRKAEPLDIDETIIDFGHRFFAPRLPLAATRHWTDTYVTDNADYCLRRRLAEEVPEWLV